MEPAVRIEHLPGRKVEQAARGGKHAAGHIRGRAEPPDGVTPSAISFSYLAATPAVISVRMMPGRTSNTARRIRPAGSANSMVTMESPALDTQYSPRFTEEV